MKFQYLLTDIEKTAKAVYEVLSPYKIWAFNAPMGSGKTTFIHALCEVLGVKDVVSSPTFSIINEYRAASETIYHMDWYRLRDEEEALQAGVGECLESGYLCLVEWPEKAAGLLPEETVFIEIEAVEENSRILSIELPKIQ